MINNAWKIGMTSKKGGGGVAPSVIGVYIGNIDPAAAGRSPWSSTFLQALESAGVGSSILGYKIPVGIISPTNGPQRTASTPGQLDPYIWVELNHISIVFDQDVNVSSSSLSINGISCTYSIESFSYGLVNGEYVAKWRISQTVNSGYTSINNNSINTAFSVYPAGTSNLRLVVPDKIRIILDASTVTGVVGGVQLAGEITNATSTLSGDATTSSGSELPSGGEPGTDFSLRVNLLPVDFAINGIVNTADSFGIRFGTYNIWRDLNGDGTADYAFTTDKDRQFTNNGYYLSRSLPNGTI